jgi:trans-aconitate 2-methyltransferase
MRYTFGTSEKAAERLKEIANFFNPLALDFIKQFVNKPVNLALDLGCGPGFTTQMLREATACKQIYGFDLSDAFLESARQHYPDYNFIKHDVTSFPFSVHADIMYTRFVLAHLKNTVTLVDKWAEELNAGGMLFIEEVEDIFTDLDVFKEYLEANRGLIASQGAELYIGKTLGKARYKNNVVHNKSILLPVLNRQAATWFFLNTITIWEQEDYIKETYAADRRRVISAKLKKIMESKKNNSNISWKMRRIVIRPQT